MSISSVIKVYSAFAPVYDATFGLVVGRYHRHIGQAAVGVRRVLELGVGTGLTLRHYPATAEVTAVDLCPAMLARAERLVARGVPARVTLQLADAERLPFVDGSFDMVVLPFVVSVTPEPARLLDEARRLLAPGGQMLILNHFAGVSGLRWLERLFTPFAERVGFRSDLTLERVLRLADLPVEEVRSLPSIGFFTLVRLRQREAQRSNRSASQFPPRPMSPRTSSRASHDVATAAASPPARPAARMAAFHNAQARPRCHVSSSGARWRLNISRWGGRKVVQAMARSHAGSPTQSWPKSIKAAS